jgi:predicted metal-dependent hydrolase
VPDAPDITVRKPAFDFTSVPRDWLAGEVLTTHFANALHLLFPAGERFFIDSVKPHLGRAGDPVLEAQLRPFVAQEMRHTLAHEQAIALLESQGYEVRSFLSRVDRFTFDVVAKRASPAFRLAVTTAIEHFTAELSAMALQDRFIDRNGARAMADLFLWHACEEIEHRSVAFDLLSRTRPSWLLRASGLLAGAAFLAWFWCAGVWHLVRQEPRERRRGLWAQLWRRRRYNALLNGGLVRAIVMALRPGFHPEDADDVRAAKDWLDERGGELNLAA